MADFEKTAKTPRTGRFLPPHRGPRRRSRLGLLMAIDAAQRPSPPRLQRGPRHRRHPFLCQSRDRRPCLVLWRKPKDPPSVGACALDPGVDATAAALHRCPPHGPSATASPQQLSVDTRRPCTCNQRPSTRSHRTVDNSLITARSEYCSFLRI